MTTDTLRCNIVDAKNYAKQLDAERYRLELMLSILNTKYSAIIGVIEANENGAQSWIIDLPMDVLYREGVTKVNWKQAVIELIKKYDMPMSSELLTYKLLLHYNNAPLDKKFVLKNISAALHYLESVDGQLLRMKDENRRGYVYGFKHFFDLISLKLKPKYFDRYQKELGYDENVSV
jgi:hypothetical protein